MSKKILVTGAGGFIGIHLIKRILSNNVEIICLDLSFDNNFDNNFDEKLIENVYKVKVDVLNEESIKNIFNVYNPHYIIHLAGYINRSSSINAFKDAMNVNYYGTFNLLNAALNIPNLEGILLFGTADEYGMAEDPYFEVSKVSPLSPYGISKNAACNLALAYHKIYKLPVNVVRPSIAYGPGQKINMFIPSIISCLLSDNKFEMSGGDQYRNFIYIDDLIKAVLLIINSKVKGEIFNLGSHESIKLKDLALKIEKLLSLKNKILLGAVPYRDTEIMNYHLNIEKSHQILGFTPEFSIDEGLIKTIKFYERHQI